MLSLRGSRKILYNFFKVKPYNQSYKKFKILLQLKHNNQKFQEILYKKNVIFNISRNL